MRDELAKYMNHRVCPECAGTRLRETARNVFVQDRILPELAGMPIGRLHVFFRELDLPGTRGQIAAKIVGEIGRRLEFLVNVGLDYLSLDRKANTLSGGETQRIRLASQIGAGLVGVMYVLDEPSIGLHQRDNQRLLDTLTYLRDLGNTVIVVEHDEDAINTADYVVDVGPGAGVHGGSIVAQGTPREVAASPASSPAAICPATSPSRSRRGALRPIRSASAASSAPPATTCATSMPAFPSVSCAASPACRARASPPWSTTRCTGTPRG